ncbi:MAG: glycosyltransferase family 4 protein [Cytophagaceae bacterium]|jgi:glycosyltransferase involved in cell wall biosynthesis|nr:glycosyltransferase family 4 protein [Cytophagaceae bacterium]
MRKLLIISERFLPEIGGVQIFSDMLANELKQHFSSVTVITKTTSRLNETSNPYTILRNPTFATLIATYCSSDIIVESSISNRFSWPKLLFFWKKHIVVLHTWLSPPKQENHFKTHLKRFLLLYRSRIVYVSNALKRGIRLKGIVIPNPYNDALFLPSPVVKEKYSIVFLGRLVSDKGVFIPIEIIRTLNQNYPHLPIRLTYIGEGVEYENIKTKIASYGLSNQIHFLGSISGPQLSLELGKHAIGIVPSIWQEPFGLVALEMQACGVIPIVNNVGGLPEAVGNPDLVVNNNSIEEYCILIHRLIQDDLFYSTAIQTSKNHLRNHTKKIIFNQYLNLIESIG